jgi:cytochrome P450
MTEDALTESENLDPERTRGDFLEFLRRAQKKDPKRMPDREMESALFTNL